MTETMTDIAIEARIADMEAGAKEIPFLKAFLTDYKRERVLHWRGRIADNDDYVNRTLRLMSEACRDREYTWDEMQMRADLHKLRFRTMKCRNLISKYNFYK